MKTTIIELESDTTNTHSLEIGMLEKYNTANEPTKKPYLTTYTKRILIVTLSLIVMGVWYISFSFFNILWMEKAIDLPQSVQINSPAMSNAKGYISSICINILVWMMIWQIYKFIKKYWL